MALAETTDSRDFYGEKVRERLAYVFTLSVVIIVLCYMYIPVAPDVRQTAGNIIFTILGLVTAVSGYYFNASPATKKPTDNSTNNTFVADKVEQTNQPPDTPK